MFYKTLNNYLDTRLINNFEYYEDFSKKQNNITSTSLPKKLLTIKFSSDYYIQNYRTFSFQSFDLFKSYFLDLNYDYKIVNKNDYADIFVIDIYTEIEEDDIKKSKYNILVSVENLKHWKNTGSTYRFFYNDEKKITKNKFWETFNGNSYVFKIDKYFHNDISIPIENQVPTIYAYIRDYLKTVNNISYKITNFKDKKDFLIINRSGHNKNINKIKEILLNKKYKIDDLSIYNNLIQNKSCYHSPELLEVFNKYKFILCFENSKGDGYITEKIFNCFLAKTIPLYNGDVSIDKFIYKESYIDIDSNYNEKIKSIINNEKEYNKIINTKKIKNIPNLEKYFEIKI